MTTKQELGRAIALLQAEYKDMGTVDGPRLEIWWKALSGFPDGAVLASAERHIMTSQFKPQLADIRGGCEAQIDGLWLGADEAWSLVPKSEEDSAMLTDEIAQALTASSSLLEMGDKVAARMAFKDAYQRLVEQAKIAGRTPRFFPSFGTDHHGRVRMLASAIQRGQVTVERALEWQPEHATDIVSMAGIKSHPLLAAPSDKGRSAVKMLLAALRAVQK